MKLNLPPLVRQYALVVTENLESLGALTKVFKLDQWLNYTVRGLGIFLDIIVNLAILTTGMSLSWPSPMLVKLRNPTETPLQTPITDLEGSWVVSAGFLLSAILNFPIGLLLDVIGRKYCILLASLAKVCMALLLIFSKEVWLVILSRTIMNTADSFILTIVPVYASEIASKEQRGALGTFLQVFSSLGVVTSLSVGPFMSYKGFSIFLMSITAVTTVPLLFVPDTPFYIYSKGQSNNAIKVLTMLRGSDIIVKEEIEEYKASLKSKYENADRITLFKNKTFLKSQCLGILLISGAQLVGFNAISFYLQTILQSTNTSVMPEIASVIIGVIQLTASFCATLVMNKFKRKTILLTSIVVMLLGMLGLGSFFQVSYSKDVVTGFMNYLPIISLILVVYSFSVGIGSVQWLVIAELFDGPGRALGFSICICFSSLLLFLTSKYFAPMTLAMGPAATYWFFSSMCVLVFFMVILFIPETKGKTFNEIQTELGEIQNTDKDVNIKNNVN